jgi:tRNA-Thr(GGU) m(6)t(6)A37 methyltransferase TsaA
LSLEEITLRPIGYVLNEVDEITPMRDGWAEITSEIHLDPALAPGLDGLEDFSHVLVVFWMHGVEESGRGVRGRVVGADGPPAGTFALRTPRRPNPVGVTTVRLLGRRDHVLRVLGLDAVSGSSVLDIKPYSERHDVAEDPTLPEWTRGLW